MADETQGDNTSMAVTRADLERFRRIIGPRRKSIQAFGDLMEWMERLSPDIWAIVFGHVSPDGEVALLRLMLRRARERAGEIGPAEVIDTSAGMFDELRLAVERQDIRLLIAEVESGEPAPTPASAATMTSAPPKAKGGKASSVKPPAKESPTELWNRLIREGKISGRRR